jgi:2,3-bisphosphoglycerate-dependent phosphoglycerate mutase
MIDINKVDPKLIEKYSKEKVEEAIEYLSYHDAPELPKEESDKYPTVYIFRHGQSEDNLNYIFSGNRDPHLTSKGVEQAKALALKLKDKELGMLISSPQIRAIETMKIAVSLNEHARGLEIVTDSRIRERDYGDLTGRSKLEAELEDHAGLMSVRRSFEHGPKNGESIKVVCERVAQFCDDLIPKVKQNNVNVAISCHGNSIRGFRRYFEGLTDEETATIETPLAQDFYAVVIK